MQQRRVSVINKICKKLCKFLTSIFYCCEQKQTKAEIIHLTHMQSKWPKNIEPCYKNPKPVSVEIDEMQKPINLDLPSNYTLFQQNALVSDNNIYNIIQEYDVVPKCNINDILEDIDNISADNIPMDIPMDIPLDILPEKHQKKTVIENSNVDIVISPDYSVVEQEQPFKFGGTNPFKDIQFY